MFGSLLDNERRRSMLMTLLAMLTQGACSQPNSAGMKQPSPPLTPEDAALRHKFRGIYGGELRVDSTFKVTTAVIINVDTGYLFNIGMGAFGPGGATVSGYGGNFAGDRLVMPKHLRMIRYPDDAPFLSAHRFPYFDGPPIVDVTVPVAERIPQEALDDLRKNGGGLRLKLRIHPETLLVGWDIVLRPGYNPAYKDPSGMSLYVSPEYSFIGGDFREAIRFNGRVVETGWYIDPRTKQRIETEY